jgi:nitrogen fixation protein FixH
VKLLLGAVVAVVLAVIVATFVVGSQVAEERVGSRAEADLRHGHAAAGAPLTGVKATFDPATLRPGGEALELMLRDGAGVPLVGAVVEVALVRPAGGGEARRATAAPLGGGRYRAAAGFDAPGFWDVRLDVRSGERSASVTQQVRIEAGGAGACDLAAGPCRAEAGTLTVTLDLGRALATMKDLPAVVEVARGGTPVVGATVEIAFAMKDMNMGENRVALAAAGGGRYAGKAVLVRCHSGRLDWIASVTVRPQGGPPVSVQFPFAVKE